ncbi:MAG: PEP-CTERM sorting domain-containing protein [Okeania sp. SIO2C9]|uniref:PEP-CTERM sorting domain-containing protein n=1 Tax=Okeania sp. SIO2C9 TaxID=2607791 RepID=UPI0013C0183F|nr:PEP-CTERM sorting domain-containing protein [Okeania sp. SIO2C9]NEQ72526.1 PEP-CTERM sorting domain-containing protein [Okeania sp. SIO2C9]NEQ72527.1 PEP-CTERM sorting domain-containing protein [Okeania sp. SIO2C9]
MIAKSLKQIALATIGTSCVAFGIATEAQAFTGTLNISNEKGFIGDADTIEFSDDDIEYFGTGVLGFLEGDAGSVDIGPLDVPGGPVDSFFTFDDNAPFTFDLDSITFAGEFRAFIMYDLMGTITDDMGTTYKVEGGFTSQLMETSGDTGSSWSLTLRTKERVPEPATMLGLGVVAAASAFGLKKNNS